MDDRQEPRPITRSDAQARGIADHTLRGPAYRKILHDSYLPAGTEVTPVERAMAALDHCGPSAFASHHTAGRFWGLWVPDDPDIHVSGLKGTRLTKATGVRRHEAHRDAEVVQRGPLRVSTPVQTYLSMAKWIDVVSLVVLGDSVVRKGFATPDELIRRADLWPGHGARKARRAAELVREGVDSPMEPRLRMLIVLAGLPEPVVNHVLHHEDGSWWMRFDLSYPHLRLAIEYDGRQHAEDPRQWQRDIDRREDMDRIGWRLVVVRAPGIYSRPDETLQRIVAALADRGVRAAVRGDEWRRHFPVRMAA